MLWIALALGILADQLTTRYGIVRYGLKVEGNPVIRAIWRRWGAAGALLAQVAILFPALWILQREAPDLAFIVPALVFAAAANNVRVGLIMARRRRRREESGRLQPPHRNGSEAGTIGE